MLIFALLLTLTTWIPLTTTVIKLRAIETLDTHSMNPIDSNVNFCITFDTHNMNPINHNSD